MTGDKEILLIVDADKMVRRILTKKLANRFDEVVDVADIPEAEQALEKKRITHLVCDIPPESGLFSKWRAAYPSIACAVLFLASGEARTESVPGADHVISKADTMTNLIDILTRPLMRA